MTKREYPRKQWVLHPRTSVPMEVKITAKRHPNFSGDYGDVDSRGRGYRTNQMFKSKSVAIRKARAVVAQRQKHLDSAQAALRDLSAAIDKVEANDD